MFFNATGQEHKKPPKYTNYVPIATKKFSVGVKGGVISGYDKYSSLKTAKDGWLVSYELGLSVDWHPHKRFSIGTDIVYMTSAMQKDFYTKYLINFATIHTSHIQYNFNSTNISIKVPISYYFGAVTMFTKVKPYVFIAPFFDNIINGHIKWSRTYVEENIIVNNYYVDLSTANSSVVNYGTYFGVGLRIKCPLNRYHFTIKMEVAYGVEFNNSFSSSEKSYSSLIYYGWGDIEHEEIGYRHSRKLEVAASILFPLRDKPKPACNTKEKYSNHYW